MNELKFRAWCDDFLKFEYFDLGDLVGCDFPDWDVDNIQRFTGLKDKHGQDIYEGDIIKINHPDDGIYKETVKFENGAFRSNGSVPIYDLIIINEGDDSEENISEVIANIYENPNFK